MSDFQQALLISGGIATLVLVTNLGTRVFERKALIRTMVICGVVGYSYLRNIPTDAHDLLAYAAAGVLAIAFGGAAIAFTTIHWSDVRQRVVTRCGVGFLAVWLLAVALRLGFIWQVEHDPGFRTWFGLFMMSHQIHPAAIAPFFVIWALGMVAIRTAWVGFRANGIQQSRQHSAQALELV